MRNRSGKAKRDKGSILADTKNLLFILHPAIQQMPKIERMEGAPQEMKMACYNIIRHFSIAMESQETRMRHIESMIGEFGVLLATFDLCIQYGLLTSSTQLRIAIQLERIEEGVTKWKNATHSNKGQARAEVTNP